MKEDIPVIVLFRALGCISDKEIIYHIIDNDGSQSDIEMCKMLRPSLEEGAVVQTEAEAIQYISKYMNHNSYYVQNEAKNWITFKIVFRKNV